MGNLFVSAAEKQTEERVTHRHYTDLKGKIGIMESGVIKESSRERGDAVFGDGVYSTQLSPSHSKCDIVENCFDMDTTTNGPYIESAANSGT